MFFFVRMWTNNMSVERLLETYVIYENICGIPTFKDKFSDTLIKY